MFKCCDIEVCLRFRNIGFRRGLLINKTVIELSLNKKALQKLTGYKWIVEQWEQVGKLFETAIL